MNQTPRDEFAVSPAELMALFSRKYGRGGVLGWGPEMRLRVGYFTPDDRYEALLNRLLKSGDAWCDVGCGREMFPSFPELARELVKRCGYVYGVDPDDNIRANPFITDRFQGRIEDCPTTSAFDLVTMRMVAEHIADPPRALARLAQLLKPRGRLVIYTPHKWAPMTIIARIIPFAFHKPLKRLAWHTEKHDTFPAYYRLNTRRDLRKHCEAAGLKEVHYERLDDCRTTAAFRFLQKLELQARTWARATGLGYPESCILAIYELFHPEE